MASEVSGIRPDAGVRSSAAAGVSGGWLVFAAVLMILGGLMALFAGISAIADDDVFATTRNYVFAFDLTAWGWIHLVVGLVVTLAGVALFQGAVWARAVGVVVATLSLIANFLWLPYTPFWAATLIALNAVVIWALCCAPSPSED
ncbi:DUF7144 family membrane protein [Streptomyces fructofermentans]|uniref:DUF7144 domain-containing protein n=1 Tax=Streptomyces fructofermentans TaxID=152141 RepID=A0A918NSQ6_9ACTN|nr:hypothetical protein [Streptomyces fructofermentans]GGX91880.1 hypothetical protein GCM10010515_68750 [Streptomyces fructofermentans]